MIEGNPNLDQKISLTHINIRQSIFFLLLKLVYVDVLATLIIIIFFYSLSLPYFSDELKLSVISSNQIYFVFMMVVKTMLTLFVVLDWLNEYYEITPTTLSHRRGLIWRKEQDYDLKHIRSVSVQQGIFGKLLNYGTITLYERELRKEIYVYLIHNPVKYLHVLRDLTASSNEEKDIIRESSLEGENELESI